MVEDTVPLTRRWDTWKPSTTNPPFPSAAPQQDALLEGALNGGVQPIGIGAGMRVPVPGLAHLLQRVSLSAGKVIRLIAAILAAGGLRAPGDRPIPGQQRQLRVPVAAVQGDVGEEGYSGDPSAWVVPLERSCHRRLWGRLCSGGDGVMSQVHTKYSPSVEGFESHVGRAGFAASRRRRHQITPYTPHYCRHGKCNSL